MAQIAIKGHPTRGKEVVEILEMLGGTQSENYLGNGIYWCYTIIDGEIDWDYPSDKYKVFTLEEFLEKFPYKVGDKVLYTRGIGEIVSMHWNPVGNEIVYDVKVDKETRQTTSDFLLRYKDKQTMEEDTKIFIGVVPTSKGNEIIPHKDYEIKQDGDKFYLVKKQPQYPKTYDECCKMLFPSSIELGKVLTSGYNCELLKKLGVLLICRDAYWKIAGEQMKLGKPWEPDWLDISTQKYCIYYVGDEIKKQPMLEVHHFLAFPTKEMRDAFYENFKELIEACKELL